MTIDFSKYKRIFAFGCSFTCYKWPTWADLIAVEAPNATYSNYGMAGMGNLGISVRIIEASKRFNFDENDLILVMWSTFCREDRWLDGRWFAQGNVYGSEYPSDWVRDYTDPFGYRIRDHALIYSTSIYLKNFNCDSIILKSTPFDYTEVPEEKDKDWPLQLSILYKKEYETLPMDFYTYTNGVWNNGIHQEFLDDWDKSVKPIWKKDCHPWTCQYYQYLNTIGIKLSDSTKKFAEDSDAWLKQKPTITEMHERYNFLRQNVTHKFELF